MNIFRKLFGHRRKETGSTTVVVSPTDDNTTPTPDDANSRQEYYCGLFLNSKEVNYLTEKSQYAELLSNFPDDKVLVFILPSTIAGMSEKHFLALDEYIALARENKVDKPFYRGIRRAGIPICYAFPKSCIPDDFDGSVFRMFKAVALYL